MAAMITRSVFTTPTHLPPAVSGFFFRLRKKEMKLFTLCRYWPPGLQLVRMPWVKRSHLALPGQVHCTPNSKQRKEVSGPRGSLRPCWLPSNRVSLAAEQSSSSVMKTTASMASSRSGF